MRNTLLKSSLKMGSATFLSRILGLVREQVMAFVFGAGVATDAFLVAYRIPNMLRDLLAEGAFSAAFIPVFTEKLQDKRKAQELYRALFLILGLITFGFVLFFFLGAEWIVWLIAPGFSDEQAELTVSLLKIMAFYLTLVSWSALSLGALHSLKIFFLPSLAPACFNIGMIVVMVYVATLQSRPVEYLALGVLLGGLLQNLIQLPSLIKCSLPGIPREFDRESIGKVLKKLGPGLLGFAATQINLIVNTVLASTTVVGAVSWLSYAFRLFQFPVGIVGVSLANSNLVHFSEAWKQERKQDSLKILGQSYSMMLLYLLGATAYLIVLAPWIVKVIFEYGQFSSEDTLMTAKALVFYAYGLPFYGLYKLWVPVFYTLDQEKIPVYCSIGGVLFNIIFCLLMVPHYGYAVLALGTTLSMGINVLCLSYFLARQLGLSLRFYFNRPFFIALLSSVFTIFLAGWLTQKSFVDPSLWWSSFAHLIVFSVAVLIAWLMALSVLGGKKFLLKGLKGQYFD